MEIILSTRNTSKIKEIRALLSGLPFDIRSLDDVGIRGTSPETGTTLEENALQKALFAWAPTKKWSMSDDTGIFIGSRDGWPGVHTGTWAGDGLPVEEFMRRILKELKDVPVSDRGAAFKTVAAVVAPDGTRMFFTGEIRGTLLSEPRTASRPMMPYSSLFVPDGYSKALAEMSIEEENAISHRGHAFRQVRAFFEGI